MPRGALAPFFVVVGALFNSIVGGGVELHVLVDASNWSFLEMSICLRDCSTASARPGGGTGKSGIISPTGEVVRSRSGGVTFSSSKSSSSV